MKYRDWMWVVSLLLLAAKLFGHINIPWWCLIIPILSPYLFAFLVALFLGICAGIWGGFVGIWQALKEKK